MDNKNDEWGNLISVRDMRVNTTNKDLFYKRKALEKRQKEKQND